MDIRNQRRRAKKKKTTRSHGSLHTSDVGNLDQTKLALGVVKLSSKFLSSTAASSLDLEL